MHILITGCAGFIGYHLTKKLLHNPNISIVGVDSLNSYYDISLKENRLADISNNLNFQFFKIDISNKEKLMILFKDFHFDKVIHLAAQAGVRYSIENPDAYIQSNIIGMYNILECCKIFNVPRLIFASSSSVYGNNSKTPYSESDVTDCPVSLYAATKKCDELLAYSYSKLYGINVTALRFFTVYGPFGRPDMAYFSFTKTFCENKKIKLFNYGNCMRDFTYIDDIIDGIEKIIFTKSNNVNEKNNVKFNIYNIGNNSPVKLTDFVSILCASLKKEGILPSDFDLDSHIDLAPMQPGDVVTTYADIDNLQKDFGFAPKTPLEEGLLSFAHWYKEYFLGGIK